MKTYANIKFIQKLSKTCWEGTHALKLLDFYLVKEDGIYMLGVFNSQINNNDKAIIGSKNFHTFKAAMEYFGNL